MARIVPAGWREFEASGAALREIETLHQLAAGLSDDYAVYHGVHWTRVHNGTAIFGEIDFALVSPAGRLLLIEQKSGLLGETVGGLVKRYARHEKSVPAQMARSAESLQKRWAAAGGERLHLDLLLYCPDYTVRQPGTAGIDPARIVDATRRDQLLPLIRSILPADETPLGQPEKLHRFLADQLELVPDVSALVGQADQLYTRLAGGLAEWGRRVEFEPFRLRVVGTAGSGKTQLALAAYRDAVRCGRRPLLVCYNRPLADHLSAIAPAGGEVATYHQLCERVLRGQGIEPDFGRPDAFARLEAEFAAAQPGPQWRFDTLIVDEGQDFTAGWRDSLLRLLAPGGRAWWLEDPMQNLYGREPVPLPGWVALRSDTNYRSPRDILAGLNALVPTDRPVEAGSPLSGAGVELLTYRDAAGLVEATKRAITKAVALGFPRGAIAVVSFRGREHSLLAPYTRLGPHALRAFTGRYDLFGSPVYSEGEIVIDSVYRFKGQAAPCVILTEIDFEALDDLGRRKLFVGATRAGVRLTLVASERAAPFLVPLLGEA
jgi:hypothetical protein